ncbi:MAG: hypothetical protein DRI61_03305 [Chloroflexi bacterium]|nr:MAG: hypothetical protein DRI61_03305 [Chloroflexota bacterium]
MASREAQLRELRQVKKVGRDTAYKLLAAGYTLFRLSNAEPSKIAEILGCSNKAAQEIINDAKSKLHAGEKLGEPLTAKEYEQFLKKRIIWFSSGSNAIDQLVGGGFRSSSTVGLSGPQATGKSQLILSTIVDCICNKGKYAMLIETELDTFDPLRVEGIARARGLIDKYDPDKLVVVDAYKVRDVATQFYYYELLRDMARDNKWDVGLIAVDSFTAMFQRKFKGREMFTDRKRELGRHLSFLEDMAKEFNAVVMLSCQVIEVPVSPEESKGGMDVVRVRAQFGTPYMPWGGHILRHTVGTWLSLEKGRSKNIWKAYLFDSSRVKLGECYFQITEKGITDVPEQLLKRLPS